MGQAIVYCSNCSAQLRGSDFESRKAFKVDDLIFCAKCCREILGKEPDAASTAPSKSKIPVPVPAKIASSTNRIPIVQPHPAPESGGGFGLYVGLGVAAVAIIIVVAMSGGSDRRDPSPPPAAPPLVVSPPPSTPPPAGSARERAAEAILSRALKTDNLEARRALLVEALAQAEGTSLIGDARRELDLVTRKIEAAKAEKSPVVVKVEPPPPPPPPPPVEVKPPPPPDRTREEAARAALWEAALAPAAGREYAAAVAALEKLGGAAPDVPLVKAAMTLHQEALLALLRMPKGQKIAVEYRDASGAPRRVEASFAEELNGRIELRGESGTVDLSVGEILPSSLADLLKARGTAVDPTTAAIYCLLEGDEAGAKRHAGDKPVPDRYWTLARNVAAKRDDARPLYREALALASDYTTAAEAAPKFQALLRDHAENAFVRRNKASLTAQFQQCGRDYLFATPDLKPSGTFKAMKSARGFTAWTSEADSDPAKLKENFLDLSFSVLPDAAYKCWIYAGACCQETFEFWVQGTELKAGKEKEPVEPGSASGMTVKPWLSSLKKLHSGHTGPKQPTTWEWVSIPLPRYSKPGLQQLRILTNQKGFSVAFACVTATRTGAPRESEMKELEKTRGTVAVAAAPSGPKATILYSPALDGTDRHLLGEVRDRALHAVPLFNAAFAGFEGGAGFKVPAQGEVRMTYFLKTGTPLLVRFRVPRGGGKSDAYDAVVPTPVAGRPTEVRLPISAFKPMAGLPFPPLAPGDAVTMLYFIGEDLNCGLRLDGFAVVEFKAEAAAKTVVAPSGKVLFAENFDAGPGRFQEGEVVDGGVKGKAYSMTFKGASAWNLTPIPAKDTVTISFKLKALGDVSGVMVLVWSDRLNDNARIHLQGFKTGEWKEVRFKATDLHIGPSGEGQSLDILGNIKMFLLGSAPETKMLLDDFEIRE